MARLAIFKLPRYADASYIEGVAVLGTLPFDHDWIVRDGKIVDPALPDAGVVYFPGLEFQGLAGIEEFLRTPRGSDCKDSPFWLAFGLGGMDSPSYRKCYDDMLAYLRRLVVPG